MDTWCPLSPLHAHITICFIYMCACLFFTIIFYCFSLGFVCGKKAWSKSTMKTIFHLFCMKTPRGFRSCLEAFGPFIVAHTRSIFLLLCVYNYLCVSVCRRSKRSSLFIVCSLLFSDAFLSYVRVHTRSLCTLLIYICVCVCSFHKFTLNLRVFVI